MIKTGNTYMRNTALFIAAVLIIMYLPFVHKPVHIDDTTFLSMAKNIRLPFTIVQEAKGYFLGRPFIMSPFHSIHPLMPYLLRTIQTLIPSESEYIYHLCLLIFPVMLIAGIRGICSDLDLPFVPAALLTVGNPAFLPVSQNLMADAPAFSLLVLALFFFIRGTRTGRTGFMAAGSAALLSATGFSYSSVLFMTLFLLYLLFIHRNRPVWIGLYLIPLLMLGGAAVYLAGTLVSWKGIMNEAMMGYREGAFINKILGSLADLGVITLFINPLFIAASRGEFKRKVIYPAVFSAAAAFAAVVFVHYPPAEGAWLFLLLFSGIFFLIRTTYETLRPENRRNQVFILLLVWLYVVILFNVLIMPFAAVRYLLPVLLPSVILPLLMLRKTGYVFRAAILTAILGIAVAYGDYLYANSYRDLPGLVQKETGSSQRVWFAGDWGMQYYMLKAGFSYLTESSNEPKQGDLIILSSVQMLVKPSPELMKRIELIDEVSFKSVFPVRVMRQDLRTGLYSHLWGLLPFTLSSGPVERFGVFRVVR